MTEQERLKERIREIRVATHMMSILDQEEKLKPILQEFDRFGLQELENQLRNSAALITRFRRVIDEVRNEQISDKKG